MASFLCIISYMCDYIFSYTTITNEVSENFLVNFVYFQNFTFTCMFYFSIIGLNTSALGTKIFKELWRSYNTLVGNLDMLFPSWEDGMDWWTIWLKHSNHEIVMHLFIWEISLVVAIGIYSTILRLFISFALQYPKLKMCPLIIRQLLQGA